MRSTISVTKSGKPLGYRPLLNIDQNAKTVKGQKKRYITGILYQAPADSSGIMNVCPMAGYCKDPCLNTAGRGRFAATQLARIAKTRLLFENRELFLECLRYDIRKLIRKAKAKARRTHRRWKACVRLNGTSDLAWLALLLASEFPELQFYDYTKLPHPELRLRENYWLTFSHDGKELANVLECNRLLAIGMNVAVVFATRRGKPLPETWHGHQVIDGDLTDLRFLDPRGQGLVIGLRAKGRARQCRTAFVQPATPLLQLQPAAA